MDAKALGPPPNPIRHALFTPNPAPEPCPLHPRAGSQDDVLDGITPKWPTSWHTNPTMRRCSLALILAATVLADLACGSKVDRGTDGSTHFWMTCSTDAECGSAGECICGHCTTECTRDAQCSDPAARCEVASSRLDCSVDESICVPDEQSPTNARDASVDAADASVEVTIGSLDDSDASVEATSGPATSGEQTAATLPPPDPTARTSNADASDAGLTACLDTPGCGWTSLPNAPFENPLLTAVHDSKFYTFKASYPTLAADTATNSGGSAVHEWRPGAFVYDTAAAQWSMLAPPPAPMMATTAEVIGDKAYVLDRDAKLFIYDFANDTWSTGASPPSTLAFASTRAANGVLYAFGGYEPQGHYDTTDTAGELETGPVLLNFTAYVYEPESDAWRRLADAPGGAGASTSCVLEDRLYVFVTPDDQGGNPEGGTLVYDMTADTWTTDPFQLDDVYGEACIALGDDLYFIPQGYGVTTMTRYRPSTDHWDEVAIMPGVTHSTAEAMDGAIFVVGDHDRSGPLESSFWSFAPSP